jgi:6-phosphogluconolactonase (cycloisomerase 2 family)
MLRNPSSLFVLVSLVVPISGCGEPAEPNAPPLTGLPAPGGPAPRVKMIPPISSVTPTSVSSHGSAQRSTASGELTLVESISRSDLMKVVRTEFSPDAKFLYATCWNPGALVTFARDVQTGKLTHVQTIDGNPELAGAGGLAISPDGRLAVVTAFQSKAVILFGRDAKSGELTRLEAAPRNAQDVEFPVAATFSPDGKFVCIADNGSGSRYGGVRVYRLEDEKLVDAGMNEGRDRCFQGARSLAFQRDGKTLFVAACAPGALVVADFDVDSGAIQIRQILWAAAKGGRDFSKSDVGQVPGIQGLMDVVPGPDGRFITTSAGRFSGPTVVASFKYGDDGHLSCVQAVKSTSTKFAGGNQVAVSPDGLSVYAAGTISGVIACASRDPKTGRLATGVVVPDGGPVGGPPNTMGAAGVTISADGRFVYVATEDKSTVSVFERKAPN